MSSADVVEIEGAVVDGGERLATIVKQMMAEPSVGKEYLHLAASSSSAEVRAWAVGVAIRVLGKDGEVFLQRLAADSVDAVAIDAIMQLGLLDRNLLRPFRDRIDGMLASDDPWDPVRAIWLLIRLDEDPRPQLMELLSHPTYPFHAIDAEIALRYLNLGEQALWDELRSHRHDWTPGLVRAAYQLHTEPARRALERCATEAPDKECRGACHHALEEWPAMT